MEITQNTRTGDFILSEAPGSLSRENAILAGGQNLLAGAIIGQLLGATAVNATAGAGEGNGLITLGAIGAHAEIGTYVLTCITEGANVGTFSVRTPSGNYLPNLTVAVPYVSPHISLTVADGADDWNAGNVINVTVAGGNYEVLDPVEDDGAQIAAGLLYAGTNATDADTACVVFKRHGEVKADGVVWPAGITEPQQTLAIAQLEARGIFLR